MLDAQYANVYYSDSLAGTHLVYPTDGRRLDNNQIWGNYETFNNYSNFLHRGIDNDYYGWCANGIFRFYWRGICITKSNYRGGQSFRNLSSGTHCWNGDLHSNIDLMLGGSGHYTIAPSCYKSVKGWH